MKCAVCKHTPFYQFYLCANNHLQCERCTDELMGRCNVCKNAVHLVKLTFIPSTESLLNDETDETISMPKAGGKYPIGFLSAAEDTRCNEVCGKYFVESTLMSTFSPNSGETNAEEQFPIKKSTSADIFVLHHKPGIVHPSVAFKRQFREARAQSLEPRRQPIIGSQRVPNESEISLEKVVDTFKYLTNGDVQPAAKINLNSKKEQGRVNKHLQMPKDFQSETPSFSVCSCERTATKKDLCPEASPISATAAKIKRLPFRCPESLCQQVLLVSELNAHLLKHSYLAMEAIYAGQRKKFLLNPLLPQFGVNNYNMLYLISRKIVDLGVGKYKDYLPLTVMSTRISPEELLGSGSKSADPKEQLLMIWPCGITTEFLPISVTLRVYLYSKKTSNYCMRVSGKISPMNTAQTTSEIFKNGTYLLLSKSQQDRLSRNGKEYLQLEIVVH